MGPRKKSRSQGQSGSHSQPSFDHPDTYLGQLERDHYQPKRS